MSIEIVISCNLVRMGGAAFLHRLVSPCRGLVIVVNIFLTEQLTARILSRYAGLIESSDLCWALRLWNRRTLDDADWQRNVRWQDVARWQTGSTPLIYSAEAKLGRWADAVAMSQVLDGRPLSRSEQAFLSYGLEARLWHPAIARAFLTQSVAETGTRMSELAIDVVASDPYLRDAFECPDGMRAEVGSVRIYRFPGANARIRSMRERLAANWRLRSMALRSHWHAGQRRSQFSHQQGTARKRKTAAFFVLSQRFMDLFQPVLSELESRGWRVDVYYYNSLRRPPENAVAFAEAAVGGRPLTHDALFMPRWVVPNALLGESPVSRSWIAVALSASWAAGKVQICRHRRLLEARRPDVVISFGSDTMGLALQGAADSLQIPSIFMSHGFFSQVRSSWFFLATASTLAGAVCVKANEKDHRGIKRSGLIATGHPPYDAMLKHSVDAQGQRNRLPGLNSPKERPYLTVVFALYSGDLCSLTMQRRVLQMLAKVLPEDVFLVCKLHPTLEEREFCETVLRGGLPRDAFRVVGETEYSTPDLLEACHVAVSHEQCQSLTDAIIMGRPAIAIKHNEFPCGTAWMTHPVWSVFKDAWWAVSNSEELRNALFVLTRDQSARHALIKHRKEYIDQFLTASDGRSSQRVADLVEHLGAGKDPGCFVPSIGKSLLVE